MAKHLRSKWREVKELAKPQPSSGKAALERDVASSVEATEALVEGALAAVEQFVDEWSDPAHPEAALPENSLGFGSERGGEFVAEFEHVNCDSEHSAKVSCLERLHHFRRNTGLPPRQEGARNGGVKSGSSSSQEPIGAVKAREEPTNLNRIAMFRREHPNLSAEFWMPPESKAKDQIP